MGKALTALMIILCAAEANAAWTKLTYDTYIFPPDITNTEVMVSNRYPSANYMLELVQGIQERCWSTANDLGSNYTELVTNIIYIYTNTDTRPYYWYSNSPLTNISGVVTGYINYTNTYVLQENGTEVWTNYLYGGWDQDVDLMGWTIDRTEYDDTVRYITALATNYATNVTESATNYTTNVLITANLGNNTRTITNALDQYNNKELYKLVTDKIYELAPYYLATNLVNSSGNFDGLTNETLPALSILAGGTNYYYYAGGVVQGDSIWEQLPDYIHIVASNIPPSTYYTNRYMNSTNVITEIKTNAGSLVFYNKGIVQFPIWTTTGGIDVVTNAWRFGDEMNDGEYYDNAWTNWTGNTYAGQYLGYSNWLARHEMIKQIKWIDRDATTQWPRSYTSGLFGAISTNIAFIRLTTNFAYGRDVNSNQATAEATALAEWGGGFTHGPEFNYYIAAYSYLTLYPDGVYDASMRSQRAILRYTNSLADFVALRTYGINYLNGLSVSEINNVFIHTTYTNKPYMYNLITSYLLAPETTSDSVLLGTDATPDFYAGTVTNEYHYLQGFRVIIDPGAELTPVTTQTYDAVQNTFIWRPDTAANSYIYQGYSYASWDEAKMMAERNLLSGTCETNGSLDIISATWGEYDVHSDDDGVPKWTARIYQQCCEAVVSNLNTNITKTIDWYVRSVPYNAAVPSASKSNCYYVATNTGDRIYYPTSIWAYVATSNYLADVHTVTSPVLGNVSRVVNITSSPTNLPAWCDDPYDYWTSGQRGYTARGYHGTEVKAVIKYDFNFCTNVVY
jgi:hypothetical protein